MGLRQDSGRNEIGMLADMQQIAETVGAQVLGYDIDWKVETTSTGGKRPDLEIRRRDGNRELLASGEAKRPETPKGRHPYNADEVRGAVHKAQSLGGRYTFTTNFLQMAIFDTEMYEETDYLKAAVGDGIELIPEAQTENRGWWKSLSRQRLETLLEDGLRAFFLSLRQLLDKGDLPKRAGKDEVYLTIFKTAADALLEEALPAFNDAVSTGRLPVGATEEATERSLNLNQHDQARYFLAQSIAEVLTAGLFYETVRPDFSLKPLLSGTKPATAERLRETLLKNLDGATTATGDYETIFGLSEAAKFVLGIESENLLTLWSDLFAALDGVRFSEVNSEIIGVIFERLISPEQRQAMGQHYTPARLARAMTHWALKDGTEITVDFCSGGGTFLVEAYNRLRRLSGRPHEEVLQQVYGNDLDSFAVHLATVNLATRDVYRGHNFPSISNRDAMTIRPGDVAVDVTPEEGEPYVLHYPDRFDVVLGNPPWDENAPNPTGFRESLNAIAGSRAAHVIPRDMPDTVNFASWFILLAAAWLKPNGRFALVLPASILQTKQRVALMTWLRRHYDIAIWYAEADVWFSDARVASMALFAEPKADAESVYGTFKFISVLEEINGELLEGSGRFPRPADTHRSRDLTELTPEADALIAGTRPDVLLEFASGENVRLVKDIPQIGLARGNKLGHAFFRLKDMEPERERSRRLVVGADIQATLPTKYLTPLFRSPMDAKTGEFDPTRRQWWALTAPEKRPSSSSLLDFIKAGERAGVTGAPSVRANGKSWWHKTWKASHVAVGVHPQYQTQVWWSDEKFVATDNFVTFQIDQKVKRADQELLAASLASAYGTLSSLYHSHEVGCEGVRWVAVEHVREWSVLNWEEVPKKDKEAVLEAYREFRNQKFSKLHALPRNTREKWKALTVAVARAASIADPEAHAETAIATAENTALRRSRREMVATSGRTKSGSSGSNQLVKDIQQYTAKLEEFRSAVEQLTNGPEVLKVKYQEPTEALFDVDNESLKVEILNRLSKILPDNTVVAPNHDLTAAATLENLLTAVQTHFAELDDRGQARPGYELILNTINDEVQKLVLKHLKDRLA